MIMVAKHAENAQWRMQVPKNLRAGLAVLGGARFGDERRRRHEVPGQNDQIGSQLIGNLYGRADKIPRPGRVVVQIAQLGDS